METPGSSVWLRLVHENGSEKNENKDQVRSHKLAHNFGCK